MDGNERPTISFVFKGRLRLSALVSASLRPAGDAFMPPV